MEAQKQKNILIAVLKAVLGLIIVLITILILALWIWNNKEESLTSISPPSQGIEPIKKYGPNEDLPGFSANIPLPKNVTEIDNLKFITPDNHGQLTKILSSDKSVKENFDFYSKALQDSGSWKIVSRLDQRANLGLMGLVAVSKEGVLNINIRSDTSTKKTIIDLSFTPK